MLIALVVGCLFFPFAFAEKKSNNVFGQILFSKFDEIREYSAKYLQSLGNPYAPSQEFPYWNFFPMLSATVFIDKPAVQWSTKCWGKNAASVTQFANESGVFLAVKIIASQPTSLFKECEDVYMIGCTSVIDFGEEIRWIAIEPLPIKTIEFYMEVPADITEAEQWDMDTNGIRIMRYPVGKTEVHSNILKTFELFESEFTVDVPDRVEEMAIEFQTNYAHLPVTVRDPSSNRIPDPSEIKSGDPFYVHRLDGLNTLLGWAMGSTNGHVTMALWMDGELFVVESTIQDSYWPTDYIQKTPYYTWIQQATAADMQVIWAPLNDVARKAFNETAAKQWFLDQEGFNYGFKTLVFSWLDTRKSNFPCLPPDFSSNCLTWDMLSMIIAYLDRKVPEIGDMLWNYGFSKRVGAGSDRYDGRRTSELFKLSVEQGVATRDLIAVVEQDTWLYNTTRYDEPATGRVMVCCVFVCSTWKAAGLFGTLADSINCGEMTNWDDYALDIHADTYEQIVGSYSLDFNNFKVREPFAHMAEKCPSLAPDYVRTPGC